MKSNLFLFSISRKQRNALICAIALAGTGYGAFRIYNSPSVSRKREKLIRFLKTSFLIAEAVSASAETLTLVSNDLNGFLRSESDEIPLSIKQILKIARSDDFEKTLTKFSCSVTAGVLQGCGNSGKDEGSCSRGVPERMMDALFSPAGQGFASVVVGNLARNLISGFLESRTHSGASSKPSSSSGFVETLCNSELKNVIGECIQRFVSTAVSVYLDKTMDINVFDQICVSLTNPRYDAQMKGILISLLNGAVETLVRTSHEVLSANNTSSSAFATSNSNAFLEGGEIELPNDRDNTVSTMVPCSVLKKKETVVSDILQRENTGFTHCNGESHPQKTLMERISYTLSIPSNRKLFLDVSGKMAFELMHSFCEFVLSKISSFCTRTLPSISEDVGDAVIEFVRQLQAKAVLIATVCLAICLHIVNGALSFDAT